MTKAVSKVCASFFPGVGKCLVSEARAVRGFHGGSSSVSVVNPAQPSPTKWFPSACLTWHCRVWFAEVLSVGTEQKLVCNEPRVLWVGRDL